MNNPTCANVSSLPHRVVFGVSIDLAKEIETLYILTSCKTITSYQYDFKIVGNLETFVFLKSTLLKKRAPELGKTQFALKIKVSLGPQIKVSLEYKSFLKNFILFQMKFSLAATKNKLCDYSFQRICKYKTP